MSLTLTATAYYTRKTIKYGTIFIIFLIIARLSWGFGYGIYRRIFPPPPPSPTVAFGKLPELTFPYKNNSQTYTFSLETQTGELPRFPYILPVYFMPQSTTSFLSLDEATSIAKSLGFNGKGESISETVYRFGRENSPTSLDINIINKTFSVNYDLAQSDILSLHPRSTEEALTVVQNFLQSANLLPEDVVQGEKTFEFLKLESDGIKQATSLSEANFIRVNLFRIKYNELLVVTPEKKRANIWFLVSGDASRDRQVIAGEFHYFSIDTGRVATYPLKAATEAWEDLINGKAHIVEAQATGNKVTIRRVYLAYYDSGQPQGFLQPVVVFEGDGGFAAYVPAVSREYYGSKQAN